MAAVGRSGSTAEPSAAAGGTAELGSTVCIRQDKRGVRQSAAAWSAVGSCAAAGTGNTVARVAWAANTIRLAAVPVAAAVFADCAAIAIVAIAMAAIAEAVGYAAIAMVAAMVVPAVGPPVAAQVVPPAGLAAAAVPSVVAAPVAERLAAVAARVATVSVAAALSAALVPSVAVAVVVGCSIVRLAASSCPPAPSNTILPRFKRKSKMANTTERIVLLQCESIGKV